MLTRRATAVPLRNAHIGTRVDHAKWALQHADAVCFDVDSTVITSEGIDELAAYLGCGEKVAELTAAAMGGGMPFHEALALRLEAMNPSKQQVETMLSEHPTELTPGVAALIAQLHARDQHVYFVSGGFRQMIEPVAAQVNVRKDQIFANTLLFNDDGSFKSHLDSEPTSRAGGKAKVVADLKAAHGYKTVVMVGDGATDMEARDIEGGADAFIGFGGIAVREKVKAGADWFVSDFSAMISAIAPTDADGIWKLTEEDRERLIRTGNGSFVDNKSFAAAFRALNDEVRALPLEELRAATIAAKERRAKKNKEIEEYLRHSSFSQTASIWRTSDLL